jgi:nitrite reductase (NADH) small subunit
VTWHAVATLGELAAGEVRACEVGGTQLVIGRDGDRYFACQRACLHRGGDLADGIVSRGHLICPQHGWRFSTRTGANPDAPPDQPACLETYAVRIQGDAIEVDPSQKAPRA